MKRIFNILYVLPLAAAFLMSSCQNNEKDKDKDEMHANTNNDSAAQKKSDTAAAHNMQDTVGRFSKTFESRVKGAVSDASGTSAGDSVMSCIVTTIGNSETDMHFDKTVLYAPANTRVTLHLINQGTTDAMKHNFVLVKPENVDKVVKESAAAGEKKDFIPADKSLYIAATPMAVAGSSVTLAFTTPPKGEYRFICTYGDHYKKMQGRFISQ